MGPVTTSFIVLFLICLSAICSGLNIALMALDHGDLQRKAKLGNRNAQKILPLRKNTHLTLASILLVNVATISATSLVLEPALSGLFAGIVSTLLIVVFAEVLPQAYFAKKGLAWAGFFAPLLRLMNALAYPIAKPLQIMLDKIIGPTQKHLHARRELGMLINEHLGADTSELDDDEVEIIQGALELSETQVKDILTPIESVFWLTPDTKLTRKQIDTIKDKLYSRIPIFNRNLTRCFGVVLLKELVDVDFNQKLYRISDFTLHPTETIGDRTALDTALRKFITDFNHMMPVTRKKKIVGIVTIEDVIEEIVGREIIDETDLKKHRV